MKMIHLTPTEFITAQWIPPNLLGLKPGEVLRPRWNVVRRVVRVGYRLHAKDLKDEAHALLDTQKARVLAVALQDLCGARVELDGVVARALVQARRFGGPDRGIHGETVRMEAPSVMVADTRCVRLGTYYPGGGGWSHGPDGSEYDYEGGGLSTPRTVVLVRTEMGEVISGDFQRATDPVYLWYTPDLIDPASHPRPLAVWDPKASRLTWVSGEPDFTGKDHLFLAEILSCLEDVLRAGVRFNQTGMGAGNIQEGPAWPRSADAP